MSSPFSFLRVTLGKLPLSSILGRATTSPSSSSSSSSAFALLKKGSISRATWVQEKKNMQYEPSSQQKSHLPSHHPHLQQTSSSSPSLLLPWVLGLQLAQERQAKLQFAPSDAVQCRKPFEEPWMLVEEKKKSTDRVSLLGSLSHGLQRAARCFGQCHWSRGSGHGQAQFLFLIFICNCAINAWRASSPTCFVSGHRL